MLLIEEVCTGFASSRSQGFLLLRTAVFTTIEAGSYGTRPQSRLAPQTETYNHILSQLQIGLQSLLVAFWEPVLIL